MFSYFVNNKGSQFSDIRRDDFGVLQDCFQYNRCYICKMLPSIL